MHFKPSATVNFTSSFKIKWSVTVCCAVSCNNVEDGEMSVNQLIKRAQLILSAVLSLAVRVEIRNSEQ